MHNVAAAKPAAKAQGAEEAAWAVAHEPQDPPFTLFEEEADDALWETWKPWEQRQGLLRADEVRPQPAKPQRMDRKVRPPAAGHRPAKPARPKVHGRPAEASHAKAAEASAALSQTTTPTTATSATSATMTNTPAELALTPKAATAPRPDFVWAALHARRPPQKPPQFASDEARPWPSSSWLPGFGGNALLVFFALVILARCPAARVLRRRRYRLLSG